MLFMILRTNLFRNVWDVAANSFAVKLSVVALFGTWTRHAVWGNDSHGDHLNMCSSHADYPFPTGAVEDFNCLYPDADASANAFRAFCWGLTMDAAVGIHHLYQATPAQPEPNNEQNVDALERPDFERLRAQ